MNIQKKVSEPIRRISDIGIQKLGSRKMIVSHRGKFGAGIVENTLEAFDLALKSGADILEADVARIADGTFVMFHDDTLGRLTSLPARIADIEFESIRNLRLKNAIGESSTFTINTLDEFLQHVKGRCLINLDRCWEYLDEVYDRVRLHGMEEQILIKAPVHMEQGMKWLEQHDYKATIIPMITDDQYIEHFRKFPSRVNVPIVEIFIHQESDAVIQEEFIKELHGRGILVWANALTLSDRFTLCAWHDDNQSLIEGPEKGWGWLVDRGIDIIQTDWPQELNQYLKSKGCR